MRVLHAGCLAAACAWLGACAHEQLPAPQAAPRFEPWDWDGAAAQARSASPPRDSAGLLDSLVAVYQADLRSAERPGAGCQFVPSCSEYTRRALASYGPWLGVLLGYDRLVVRENVDAPARYLRVPTEHGPKLYDPVP